MTGYQTAPQLARRIEEADALDQPAQQLSQLAQKLVGAPAVRDVLSGSWLGHPAHPALIAAPIGMLGSASLLDLTGRRRAAQTLVGAGLLTILPAALTGLSDWTDTSGAERRVGLVHMASNTVASALYLMSWRSRRRDHHFRGAALSLLGASALTAGGWLGGHLSYALGVGVDTNAFSAGPTEWTALQGASAADLEADGSPVRAVAGSSAVVASRQPDGVRVLAERCSHRGGPLSEGSVDGSCITCPWHGSRFDLDTGAVVQGPAVVGQPAYEVRESGGAVEVRRDEQRALRTNSVKA